MNRSKPLLQLFLACAAISAAGVAFAAELQATLDWARRVELSTPVSGTVTKVMVEPGARVGQGDTLLTLDPRPFQARVARARAELASAQETLAEARREVERAQELFDRQVMSTHELQLEKIALTEAQSAHQKAKSELELAQLELEYATVHAPYDAVVLQRRVEPGQTVVTRLQTTPLLVLAGAERMLARARVSAAQLAQFKPGSEVEVRVEGRAYRGTVGNLGLEPEDTADGPRYGIEVQIPAAAGQDLRAGQPATLVLP